MSHYLTEVVLSIHIHNPRQIDTLGSNAILGRCFLGRGQPGTGYDRNGPGTRRNDGKV